MKLRHHIPLCIESDKIEGIVRTLNTMDPHFRFECTGRMLVVTVLDEMVPVSVAPQLFYNLGILTQAIMAAKVDLDLNELHKSIVN